MSTLKTTITVDGEEIERDSTRAFEVYGREVRQLAVRLNEINMIRPDRLDKDGHAAFRALSTVASRAQLVTDRARQLERLDKSPEEALAQALADADFAEGRS